MVPPDCVFKRICLCMEAIGFLSFKIFSEYSALFKASVILMFCLLFFQYSYQNDGNANGDDAKGYGQVGQK